MPNVVPEINTPRRERVGAAVACYRHRLVLFTCIPRGVHVSLLRTSFPFNRDPISPTGWRRSPCQPTFRNKSLSSPPPSSPLARVRAISPCPPLFRTRHHRYKTIVRYDEEASISPDNLPDRNSRTIMANNHCSVSPDYIFQENIYSSPIENRTRGRHAAAIKQTWVCARYGRRFADNSKIPSSKRIPVSSRRRRGEIRELSSRFFPRASCG